MSFQEKVPADRYVQQAMVDSQKKISRETVIINALGLHARSAAQIANLAARASAKIWLVKGGESAEATSIMDLLALECPRGTKVAIIIEDPSDLDVLNAISQLIENGFGE
jgi:phosphotransferase system HPr (HPr) family protein